MMSVKNQNMLGFSLKCFLFTVIFYCSILLSKHPNLLHFCPYSEVEHEHVTAGTQETCTEDLYEWI